MDIKTTFISFDRGADYAQAALGLAEDDGLETAVILSLFTDRRAEADDPLPAGDDRRGWWADAFPAVPGDLVGSRLWLLHREKQIPQTLTRARDYAEEALAWLVADGIAARVDVSAEVVRTGVLGLSVEIQRTAGPNARYRFESFWGAQ